MPLQFFPRTGKRFGFLHETELNLKDLGTCPRNAYGLEILETTRVHSRNCHVRKNINNTISDI